MNDYTDFVESAKKYMDSGKHVRAFFCLALEAVAQLARIADGLEKLDEAIDHSRGCVITRPAYHD